MPVGKTPAQTDDISTIVRQNAEETVIIVSVLHHRVFLFLPFPGPLRPRIGLRRARESSRTPADRL